MIDVKLPQVEEATIRTTPDRSLHDLAPIIVLGEWHLADIVVKGKIKPVNIDSTDPSEPWIYPYFPIENYVLSNKIIHPDDYLTDFKPFVLKLLQAFGTDNASMQNTLNKMHANFIIGDYQKNQFQKWVTEANIAGTGV